MGVANMIDPNVTVRTRAGSLQRCIFTWEMAISQFGDKFRKIKGPQVVLLVLTCWQNANVNSTLQMHTTPMRVTNHLYRIKIALEALKRSFHLI